MKYTKEDIEERLKERISDLLEYANQEDGLISVTYDEKKKQCTIKMDVHIVEDDDYVGFASY